MRRTLVVPMFREAPGIGGCIATIAGSALHDSETEFLFVDDGSDDGTPDRAEAALAAHDLPGRVVRCSSNRGKGAAVRAGMLRATGEVTAFADADLAADVDEIERCLSIVESGTAEVVFATRVHRDATITRLPTWRRRLGGKTFNTALRALGLTPYTDTQCGLKAFTRRASDFLFSDLGIDGFAFDVEVLYRAGLAGMTIAEVPITWRHVDSDRVRLLRDGVGMFVDVVQMRRRLSVARSAVPARAPAGVETRRETMTPVPADGHRTR